MELECRWVNCILPGGVGLKLQVYGTSLLDILFENGLVARDIESVVQGTTMNSN